MKSDLDLVIKALEDEKKFLERQIKETTSEFDYLIAYYHSEALMQLNNRLDTLYTFKDTLYNERRHLKAVAERIKKYKPDSVKDKQMWERMKSRRQEMIESDLLQLEEKSKSIDKFFVDGQEIDDALFDLYEGKCKAFKLLLDEYDDFEFNFKLNAELLIITISGSFLSHEQDFILDHRISNPFAGLGFKFDQTEECYIYMYNMAYFNDAWPIKKLLARFFFDVFRAYNTQSPAKLIYL